jgi:hypothetical protein
MNMSDYTLELRRDSLDEHGHPTGFLWLKERRSPNGFFAGVIYFHTRERGHGYVFLRTGTYTMEHSTLTQFPKVQCLRPVGIKDPQHAACLIHPITRYVKNPDSPDVLEGCIAPFMVGTAEVPGSSDSAMDAIWKSVGGWQKGKKLTFEVLNDVPVK